MKPIIVFILTVFTLNCFAAADSKHYPKPGPNAEYVFTSEADAAHYCPHPNDIAYQQTQKRFMGINMISGYNAWGFLPDANAVPKLPLDIKFAPMDGEGGTYGWMWENQATCSYQYLTVDGTPRILKMAAVYSYHCLSSTKK